MANGLPRKTNRIFKTMLPALEELKGEVIDAHRISGKMKEQGIRNIPTFQDIGAVLRVHCEKQSERVNGAACTWIYRG